MAPPQNPISRFCFFFLNQSPIATLMLYRQPFQKSVADHHKTFTSLPCISWGRSAGCWGSTVHISHFLNPTDNPGQVFLMTMAGAQKGKPSLYKDILNLCLYQSSANIPLVKTSHVTKPSICGIGSCIPLMVVGSFRRVMTNILFWGKKGWVFFFW